MSNHDMDIEPPQLVEEEPLESEDFQKLPSGDQEIVGPLTHVGMFMPEKTSKKKAPGVSQAYQNIN